MTLTTSDLLALKRVCPCHPWKNLARIVFLSYVACNGTGNPPISNVFLFFLLGNCTLILILEKPFQLVSFRDRIMSGPPVDIFGQ